MKQLVYILFLGGIYILTLPEYAHAYIDPGTGSVILQGLAAGVVAVAAFWKQILNSISKLCKRTNKNEKNK